jgi:hypothetical protein
LLLCYTAAAAAAAAAAGVSLYNRVYGRGLFTSLQSVHLLNDEGLLQRKMMEAHTYLTLLDPTNLYLADSMAIEMMSRTLGGMAHWPRPNSDWR